MGWSTVEVVTRIFIVTSQSTAIAPKHIGGDMRQADYPQNSREVSARVSRHYLMVFLALGVRNWF